MFLALTREHLRKVHAGEKTTTIRLWRQCSLTPGRVLHFPDRSRAIVTAITFRTLDQLDDDDAHADGFISRRALIRALHRHYPRLAPTDRVCILAFRSAA